MKTWTWIVVLGAVGCSPRDASDDEGGDTDDTDVVDDGSDPASGDSGGQTDTEPPPDSGTEPDGDPVATCGRSETRLVGEVDGTVFDELYAPDSFAFHGATHADFGTRGELFLAGVPEQPDRPTTGWIRTAEESTRPGLWLCAGDGSVHDPFRQGRYTADLRSVTALGTCDDGAPVAGTIRLCLEPACPQGSLESDVPGAEFVAPVASSAGEQPLGGTTATWTAYPDGGMLRMDIVGIDPEATDPQQAGVGTAYLIVPVGPDAGAVYCIGSGSVDVGFGEGGEALPVVASLGDLRRIGTCPTEPAGTGALAFCTNWNE